jgi:hypothetical protein
MMAFTVFGAFTAFEGGGREWVGLGSITHIILVEA